jgi:hypothetical protein
MGSAVVGHGPGHFMEAVAAMGTSLSRVSDGKPIDSVTPSSLAHFLNGLPICTTSAKHPRVFDRITYSP